jgi:hypothetical protein
MTLSKKQTQTKKGLEHDSSGRGLASGFNLQYLKKERKNPVMQSAKSRK